MTRIEAAQQFLTDLLGPIPEDSCIEFRLKKNDEKGTRREWHTSVATVDPPKYAHDEHVWFGVCLRKAGATSGKLDDVTWATCVWADFDNVVDKDSLVARLTRFPHPPHYIVDSGGGIHAYWRLSRLMDMQNETDRLYVREVVHGLAHILGADETVHDPTRVMRLPGTFNVGNGRTKNYSPARETQVLHKNTAPAYDLSDLSRYRRVMADKADATVTTLPTSVSPVDAAQLKITARLKKLIKDGWTQGCGYQSRSELDLAIMVGLIKAGHTEQDIVSVFNDPQSKIGDKMREKAADGPRYLQATFASAQQWIAQQSKPAEAGIRENNGKLEVRRSDKWEMVFDRPMKAVARLTGEERGFRVEIMTPDGPVQTTIRARDFVSNREFKSALDMTGAWLGSDRDVQMLIPFLEAQQPPVRRSVRTIGWDKDHVVFPDAILLPDDTLAQNVDYLYTGSDKLSATLLDSSDWTNLAQEVFRLLPDLHIRSAMIPIIGWFMATFVAPQIRNQSPDRAFPFLMLFGTPEAGKTNILEQMQRLTGVRGALQEAPTTTKFANIDLLSSTNSAPVVYDEHRRTDVKVHRYNLYPLLRSAYQAGITTRGQANLSVVRYRLQAPVALGGETPFRDPALIDRTVHVRLERTGKNSTVFHSLAALPLHEFNVGMYRHVKTKDVAALFARAEQLLPTALRHNDLQQRQRHAWTVVATGLLLCEPFWPTQDVEKMISDLADFRKETSEDVAVSTKAVTLEAIRVIAELARGRRIKEGQDYVIRQEGSDTYLWFVPSVVVPAIEEYFMKFPTDLPMVKEAILARMREGVTQGDPLIVKYQQTFRLGTKTAKGIAIWLEKVEEELGIPVDYWTQNAIAYSNNL